MCQKIDSFNMLMFNSFPKLLMGDTMMAECQTSKLPLYPLLLISYARQSKKDDESTLLFHKL